MDKRRSAKVGKRTELSPVRKTATQRFAPNKELVPNTRRQDILPQFRLSETPGKIRELIGKSENKSAPSKALEGRQQKTSKSTVDFIICRATEVLGSKEKAMRWLGTPVRGLDFATPISLLATKKGQTRVNDILGQMEHGIW